MRPPFRQFELSLIVLLILAFMVHMTGLAQAVTPLSVPTAMVIEYGVIAIFGMAALLRGHLLVFFGGLAFVGYLLLQCYVWNQITGFAMNLNAVLSYGTLLICIVFYETRIQVETILRIILGFSIAYLVIYGLFWEVILDIVGRGDKIYLPSDGTRGPRLYLAAPFATFVFMYAITSFRRNPLLSIPLLVMSGYALFIAQTRFAMILLGIAFLAAIVGSIAGELRKAANITLAFLFLTICTFSLAGFLVPNWNPYLAISGDSSGNARAVQYLDGVTALSGHLWTGLGIAGSTLDVQFFLHPNRPFFAGDLGIAGVVVLFGLPVTLLFIMICLNFILRPTRPFGQMGQMAVALFYVTQQAAFGSVFNFDLMGGPATLFGSITLALWLQDAKANLGRQTVPAQAAQFPGATGSDGAAPGLDKEQPSAGPIRDRGEA